MEFLADIRSVCGGALLHVVKEGVARLENARVVREQAEYDAHEDLLQVGTFMAFSRQRVVQPPHQFRGFDVDRILVPELSPLDAEDEAEAFHMLR